MTITRKQAEKYCNCFKRRASLYTEILQQTQQQHGGAAMTESFLKESFMRYSSNETC